MIFRMTAHIFMYVAGFSDLPPLTQHWLLGHFCFSSAYRALSASFFPISLRRSCLYYIARSQYGSTCRSYEYISDAWIEY